MIKNPNGIKEKLKGVNKSRMFEQAVEQIRSLIQQGDIPPGDKLPTEQELSEALNMSRASIREALRVLEAEGLIETRQGAGTFVQADLFSVSKNDVRVWLKQRGESLVQLLEVREYIEGLTASLAARDHSDELIADLTSLVDQLAEIGKQDQEAINFDVTAKINTQFHLTISRYSGNDIANEILLHILPSFEQSNKAVLYTHKNIEIQSQEHRQILEAIMSSDSEMAEKLMRHHISRVRREIELIREEI